MSLGDAVSDGFKRYADFWGRSNRAQYWYWVLFHVLIIFGFGFVAVVFAALLGRDAGAAAIGVAVLLWLLFWLATVIPTLALRFRRLHDCGLSAWLLLIAFVPFVGGVALLVIDCIAGQPGPNAYGPPPGKIAPAEVF